MQWIEMNSASTTVINDIYGFNVKERGEGLGRGVQHFIHKYTSEH
jgi:hypothetical protein